MSDVGDTTLTAVALVQAMSYPDEDGAVSALLEPLDEAERGSLACCLAAMLGQFVTLSGISIEDFAAQGRRVGLARLGNDSDA